jgi:hypothetical protein
MSSTKSGKAKGRRLQNWVRDKLKDRHGLNDDDVKCALMGESGADVKLLSKEARNAFPFNIECKNAEAVNVWKAYEQAKTHGDLEPLLVIKKNGKNPIVVLDAAYFMELCMYA